MRGRFVDGGRLDSYLLTAPAVPVAVEVSAVARLAYVDGRSARGPNGCAVWVVRSSGSGSDRGGRGSNRSGSNRGGSNRGGSNRGGSRGRRRWSGGSRGRFRCMNRLGRLLVGWRQLIRAVSQNSCHSIVLGLRHPQRVNSFDGDLPGDVFATVSVVRRQPGGRVAVTLLLVGGAVS